MMLLEKLFTRHFSDTPDALRRFHTNLSRVKLPVDILGRLRELEFPPYPGFECGMPSFVYYFLPGTRWGTFAKAALSSPTHDDFVYNVDGVGMNLGCPVRLARALEILFTLPEVDRQECLEGLSLATKHFATVEELLWLSIWDGIIQKQRGGILPGSKNAKNVDWFVVVQSQGLYLESKFRPADWPRMTDRGTHEPMSGFLLQKAADQFPKTKTGKALYLVGLTGFAEPNSYFASLCDAELASNPHIDGLLFRTLIGSVHVFTRYESVLATLYPLIAQIPSENFPWHYPVQIHRQQRADRIAARGGKVLQPKSSGSINYGRKVPLPFKNPRVIAPDPYHMRIVEYLADGEPLFESITKNIWIDAAGNPLPPRKSLPA